MAGASAPRPATATATATSNCAPPSPAGEIAFESETESPKYGKLLWRGVVRGTRMDATLTMMRDGIAAGEKWILAGQS